MKITILMPVFNEEKNIVEAISSVLEQTITDWELLIINDGSTDKTVQIIEMYSDQRITLLNKENSDQLDSLKYATPYITGELVYLLHGDDRIHSNEVFKDTLDVFLDASIDYIEYPYCIMDSKGKITSIIKPKRVYENRFLRANLLLNFGRNLKVDHFFCRKRFFDDTIFVNYLNRNKPFWLGGKYGAKGNSSTVSYPVFDYRSHEGNYLNSKVGLYNVINGNIRSTLDLLEVVSVPFFTAQRYLFKVYNKLDLIGLPVIYKNKPSKGIVSLNILNQLLSIYNVNFDDYRLLKLVRKYQLEAFTTVLDLSDRVISENEKFGPAQIRLLNKAILEDTPELLPVAFNGILENLERGVGEIICSTNNRGYVEEYLDLLNIRIKVKNV